MTVSDGIGGTRDPFDRLVYEFVQDVQLGRIGALPDCFDRLGNSYHAATLNSVVFKGARVGISRRDVEVVYITSARDLRLLEALEDRLDTEDVREAVPRHQAAGGDTVRLDELKRRSKSWPVASGLT